MNDEVRTEAPEKITGDLNDQPVAEAPMPEALKDEMPKAESTVSQGPVDTGQPMVVTPDGTRRPATPEEIRTFERTQACGRELNALLDRFDCTMDVSMILTTRGVIPQIQVVPRVKQEESE